MARLQIRRLAYALGAEVRGVDLSRPLDDATFGAIREAWLEHMLLCFPGQDLDHEQYQAFARRFGDLETIRQNQHPETPHISVMTNRPKDDKPWVGYKSGQFWHSDKSFTTLPTSATMLLCKEIPAAGGDTMFANQYMAYETLSPALQTILEGLEALHDASKLRESSRAFGDRAGELMAKAAAERAAFFRLTVQPLVRVHPETKRKSLYASERIRRFIGMTEEETKPFLDYLLQHAVRYEFCYRHRYAPGDLVMWDNRCMLHIAVVDYDLRTDIRTMWRLSVKGDASGREYAEDGAAAAGAAAG